MNIRDFKERLFTEGTKAGFTDMEIFVSNSSNFRLQVFNKEVDNYSLSQIRELAFVVFIMAKWVTPIPKLLMMNRLPFN